MRSKEIFVEKDRIVMRVLVSNNEVTPFHQDMYQALLIAEAEIEELREKLHRANVEIGNLIDLRPEN